MRNLSAAPNLGMNVRSDNPDDDDDEDDEVNINLACRFSSLLSIVCKSRHLIMSP